MGPVIVESNCARIVEAMQRGSDRSEIGFVIAEARELAQALVDWRMALVKRECNTVANELAQLASRNSHAYCCLARPSTCVCLGPASC